MFQEILQVGNGGGSMKNWTEIGFKHNGDTISIPDSADYVLLVLVDTNNYYRNPTIIPKYLWDSNFILEFNVPVTDRCFYTFSTPSNGTRTITGVGGSYSAHLYVAYV